MRGVGDDVVRDAAQQDAVAAALPLHDAVAGRLPAVSGAERRLGDLADPEELFPERVLGNLVIEPVLDPVNREDALVGLRLFGDDAVVGPNLRLRCPAAAAAAGVLRLRVWWRRGWGSCASATVENARTLASTAH